jgi:hypothetical protein
MVSTHLQVELRFGLRVNVNTCDPINVGILIESHWTVAVVEVGCRLLDLLIISLDCFDRSTTGIAIRSSSS